MVTQHYFRHIIDRQTYSSIRPKQIIEFGAIALVFYIKATKIIVFTLKRQL